MDNTWIIFILGGAIGAVVTLALANRRQVGKSTGVPENPEAKAAVDLPLMLDALDEAILVIDQDKTIVLANHACRKFFPAVVELPGRRLPAVILDPRLNDAVDACLADATPASMAMRDDTAGESHWLANIARLPQTNGRRLVRVIIRDETERAQTEQIRREFVANASHELRTPLTIVHGYIESLLDGACDQPELARRFLKTARRHTERMARLIEDMLSIAKLESSDTGLLKIKEFSLSKCLRRVTDNLGPLLEQQQVHMDIGIDPAVERIVGDRFYWEQILFNLIENATKNNPQPGLTVKVTATRMDDGQVEIVIADNGLGIPKAALPFIFKRFYRVQKDHSTEIPGTGLGLSIVKRAVEAHGGNIRVESQPGLRTAFTILLPPAVAG